MGKAATILIIDDEALVRRVFSRVLERDGMRVLTAIDGTSGLQLFREHHPDAVLLDLRMPGMDGLDVLSTLVQEFPEIPTLVVSGGGTMTDVVEALRRGAWDFVTKPVVDSELLLRGIRRSLEKATLLRQNREYSENLRDINQRLSRALEELRADERAARQLQFQLLPEDGFHLAGYTCSQRLLPSQLLSGDFLDYFPLGDQYLGLYLADVAGHGTASALVTAILTTLVERYRQTYTQGDETLLNPEVFLAQLDTDLSSRRLDKHVTMFYGVVELASGRMVYSNAGAYPFPFLHNGHDTVTELECPGRPLNLPGTGRWSRHVTEISPGGRLLIASDGILELSPIRTHQESRHVLGKALHRTHTLEAMLKELALDESTRLRDDVALLFVRREVPIGQL